MPTKRGTCSVCGKDVPLRLDGTPRGNHDRTRVTRAKKGRTTTKTDRCPGSDRETVEAQRKRLRREGRPYKEHIDG